MENLIETNGLIAKFVGYESANHAGIDKFKINNLWWETDDLYFHKSWDWLMPVVEECISLDEVYEMNNYGQYYNNIQDALWTINIDEVYKAVINFIKWYHNEK